jgi:hypothetical protein
VALLVDGELDDVDDVWDEVESVLEADGEVVVCGGGGEEFDVVGVGRLVEAEAVLVLVLGRVSGVINQGYEVGASKGIGNVQIRRRCPGRPLCSPSGLRARSATS